MACLLVQPFITFLETFKTDICSRFQVNIFLLTLTSIDDYKFGKVNIYLILETLKYIILHRILRCQTHAAIR